MSKYRATARKLTDLPEDFPGEDLQEDVGTVLRPLKSIAATGETRTVATDEPLAAEREAFEILRTLEDDPRNTRRDPSALDSTGTIRLQTSEHVLPGRGARRGGKRTRPVEEPIFADERGFRERRPNDLAWKIVYRGFALLLSSSVTVWCLQTDNLIFLAPALGAIAIVCYFIVKG